ncbi:MAG: alpha/beta fold hydrolase [Atribacterota bacterium]
MKTKIIYIIALGFLLSSTFLEYSQANSSENPTLFLTLLKEERYEEAYKMEDQKMQELLPQHTLQKMWENMKKNLGKLMSFETRATTTKDGYLVANILCRFEKMTLLAQVAIDSEGKVASLYFLPYTEHQYTLPPYVDQDRFSEREITFGVPEWELPGTLTIPREKGPFPAVVLVHGSGPNDRDETVMGNKPFRDIAWGLATQGVATLRYDKRTYVYGMKISSSPEISRFTVEEEVITDTLQALQFLSRQPEIDPEKVFLFGHSLGGYLAPEIAFRDGKLKGIILCAAPARPLHQLIPEQMEYVFSLDGVLASDETQQLKAIQKAVEGINQRIFAPEEIVTELGGHAIYFYSLMDINPLKSAQKILVPILIIQGGRDYQVTEKDWNLWKETLVSKLAVSFQCYPSLNHLLCPGKGTPSPQEYETPNHVDGNLVQDIAEWIKKRAYSKE